ncbi:branched-chain amino acid transport system ATP-binding protein [Parafrankia irregularis]|uniref:Branched-chain amino acid transport system ATP-binding protein n=1 Tax=Parafrankia irregularis TaxID=795642 RepID=A0A0S4QJF8_9ACTN|nr:MULTISPECIES: ABC transporter ATP-binding protein [Parafrankia]MBE3200970.1 ABC transporter ATP-binding protein [Parafrankia sp. CH37]CUU54630.1 branched-chain amino acid transport system ATP-binding protein [Parafrankia irregularis]
MALLEVRDVTVAFGGVRALSDVAISVEGGRITGLIGPNGAGKSTLFDVISGLRRPSSGQVFIDGHEVTRLGPTRRSRHGLARTFQRLELFGRLSVRDNLLVAAELGAHRRQAAALVDEILDRVGLTRLADTSADTLSTGVARLVEVARALAARPKLLLLDEPAAGQDPEETERFAELLRSLAAEGTTVLIVEHDMDLVMSVCDDLHVLDLGRVIASGRPDEIRRNELVLAAYLGDAA